MDKWNKQGGSNRDNINKPRKKKRISESIIRPLKSIKESDSVSPKIVAQKKRSAQYGQFGDEVQFIIDPVTDLVLPEIKINDYDYEYELRPNVVPTRILDDRLEFFRNNRSEILSVRRVLSRYQIFVRFGRGAPILIIIPGQAYMARTGINNKRFDRSLVVISDLPIIFDAKPSTTNVIKLSGNTSSEYEIVDSLYRWINESTGLITDITGQQSNPILANLNSNNAPQLPPINFTANSELYGLFGGLGRQVDQICLAAIDTVLEFDRNDGSFSPTIEPYSVLLAGARIAVCSPRLKKEYRVIAVFFTTTANGFRYGGYNEEGDSQNLISPRSLTQFNTPQNDPGFNIISPGSQYWSDLTARFGTTDSDGVTTFTEPYWEFSFINSSPLFPNQLQFAFLCSNGDNFIIGLTGRFNVASIRNFVYSGFGTRMLIGNVFLPELVSPSVLTNSIPSNRPVGGVSPFDSSDPNRFGFISFNNDSIGVQSWISPNNGSFAGVERYNGIYIIKPTKIEYKIYKSTRPIPYVNTSSNVSIPPNTVNSPLISRNVAAQVNDTCEVVQVFSDGTSSDYIGSTFSAKYSNLSTFNQSISNTNIREIRLRGQLVGVVRDSVFVEERTRVSRESFKIKVPILIGQLTIFKQLEILDGEFLNIQESSNNLSTTPPGVIENPTPPGVIENPSGRINRFITTSTSSTSGSVFCRNNVTNPLYTIDLLTLSISQILIDRLQNSFFSNPSIGQIIQVPIDINVESNYLKQYTATLNLNKNTVQIYKITGLIPGNEQERTTITIGDITTGLINVEVSIETSKIESYKILESINFMILTNEKIYSCKINNLTYTRSTSSIYDDFLDGGNRISRRNIETDELFRSSISTDNVIGSAGFTSNLYTPPTVRILNNNSRDSVPVNISRSFTGFDSDLVVNPDSALGFRKITGINATIVSIKNHEVSDYLPSGQSRILIPNMAYFNPERTILTGANPSKPQDNGLVAKLFRTTKRTQIAATVEVWGIRDNGEFDLLELLDTPIGDYPGSTERIMYYPGDIQL